MRRRCLFFILCHLTFSMAMAQRITRHYDNVSMSKALMELNDLQQDYTVNFIYDELEDFKVTTDIKHKTLPDAVSQVVGFYPVRVTVKGHDIIVECIQKDHTKLTGRLIGPDRQPIAYANITLFPPTDSTYIGGGVSNEAGYFVIPCGAAQARVRISCVGLKTIERQVAIGDVGTIRMQMENHLLGNVTVSGLTPVIRNEAGRLQYIVSNDEFARGLNAQELLNRVPMVSMAGGRAMILGKGPARFMLNGHFTEMGDETIQQKLWTIPSEDIDRIEVISIPSGRDIMEMGGGYINIVMHHDQTLGWRGDVNAEAGISDDWSGRTSGSVSYASKKFDMTIDAHSGYTTKTTDNLLDYRASLGYGAVSNTHSEQKDKDIAANVTFRFLPAKGLELGGMLSWQKRWPEKITDGEITYRDRSLLSTVEQTPYDNTCTKNLTAYCDWRIGTKGTMLSLTYNNFKKDDDARIDVRNTNQSTYNYDYHIQSGRLDLRLPFDNSIFDIGTSYTDIHNKNDDHFFYTNNCIETYTATYASLHHQWGRCSIKAGFRYERIEQSRKFENSTESRNVFMSSHDYWLPSLSFSFKPKEDQLLSLTWGMGCVRPNFYDLSAITIYKTGYESFSGSPLLLPNKTSNAELSYHNHKGFNACAYYHHTSDAVERFTLYNAYPNTITINTAPQNRGRIDQTGLYLHYQRPLTSSLLVTAEGESYYYNYNNRLSRSNHYCAQRIYGWGKRLALSADWYINHQHTLLLNARYQHWFSDYTELTHTDGYGYFNFALRYSMMGDRLRLSLVANDPFHQHVTDEILYNAWLSEERVLQYSHTKHHSHYVGITATYSLGGKKVRQIRHDMKNDEIKRAEAK